MIPHWFVTFQSVLHELWRILVEIYKRKSQVISIEEHDRRTISNDCLLIKFRREQLFDRLRFKEISRASIIIEFEQTFPSRRNDSKLNFEELKVRREKRDSIWVDLFNFVFVWLRETEQRRNVDIFLSFCAFVFLDATKQCDRLNSIRRFLRGNSTKRNSFESKEKENFRIIFQRFQIKTFEDGFRWTATGRDRKTLRRNKREKSSEGKISKGKF